MENIFGIACLYYLTNEDETDVEPHLITGLFTHGSTTTFQWIRDQAIDSEEVVTPLMLDGTYLSRNFATLGPMIRQPPCDFLFFIDYYVITRLRAPSGCLADSTTTFQWIRPVLQVMSRRTIRQAAANKQEKRWTVQELGSG